MTAAAAFLFKGGLYGKKGTFAGFGGDVRGSCRRRTGNCGSGGGQPRCAAAGPFGFGRSRKCLESGGAGRRRRFAVDAV